MDENKTFVAEDAAENVEQTTEETVAEPEKMFTQEDLNAAVGKAKARERAKITKQFERKYGDLEEVLKAGTGKESVEELTDTFTEFYSRKGIKVEKKPELADSDIEILARADAEEIIRYGFEEAVEEADRLKDKGVANMTARERAVFKVLAEYVQTTANYKELAKVGVTEEVYNSPEFKEFASMFSPNTPITKVYETYTKQLPKKEIKTMGSMKSSAVNDSAIKEYYSPEEARKFTKKDFDNNPALWEAVLQSSYKWK